MIRQCPVNMELRLHDVPDMQPHDILIGKLVQTYADDSVMTERSIDITRVRPLLFDIADKRYWSLGHSAGKCWHAGKRPEEKWKESIITL